MRSLNIKLVVFVFIAMVELLSPTAYAGTNRYVSPVGTDVPGCGTGTAPPCKTVSYAAGLAYSGDTINVAAGTYIETRQIVLNAGVNLIGAGQGQTTLTVASSFPTTTPLISMRSTSISAVGQTVSNLTIDGNQHALYAAIDARNRSNLSFFNLTVQNCQYWAIDVASAQIWSGKDTNGNSYSWPKSNTAGNYPADSDYVDNIQIYDSTFNNNGFTPAGATWSYGDVYFFGIKNSVINRVTIDETTYGGYGIKGVWAKNLTIFRCDCRMKPLSPTGSKGFSIEVWYVLGGDVFDNQSNGGISLAYNDGVHLHHNWIVMPATDAAGEGVEFGGFRSVVDHNYLEGTGPGVALWALSDTINVQNNIIRGSKSAVFISATTTDTANPLYLKNINIDNNTIDLSKPLWNEGAIGMRVQDAYSSLTNIMVRNNIISNSAASSDNHYGGAISLNGQNGSCSNSSGITGIYIGNTLFYNNSPADFTPACGVLTSQQSNMFGTSPAFNGTLPSPTPYYQLATTSPARNGGAFIGLPSEGSGNPDMGAYIPPVAGQPIEAEMNYSVVSDLGTYPIQPDTFNLASGGHGLALYDAGDTARVHLYANSDGNYVITARVRSGDVDSPVDYFLGGYSYRLDGIPITLTGDPTSVSAFDSSGGGVYWGTMVSVPVALPAGPHSLEITAIKPWCMVDYIAVH